MLSACAAVPAISETASNVATAMMNLRIDVFAF
jgi:hypothetical protein